MTHYVLAGESPGIRCLGGQTQYFSYAAEELGGYTDTGISKGIDYKPDPGGNYHQDKIDETHSCVLAARIALYNSWAARKPLPCETCPNAEIVNADPIVKKLRELHAQ